MADLRIVQLVAQELMKQWNVPPEWSFDFDRGLRRFGHCKYKEKQITLSRHLCSLNEMPDIIDTILHEISHILAGSKAGHGPLWKAKALIVGCKPIRCFDDEIETPVSRFIAECPNCHKQLSVHRRRKKRVSACSKCCKAHNGGRFDTRFLFQYRENPAWQPI